MQSRFFFKLTRQKNVSFFDERLHNTVLRVSGPNAQSSAVTAHVGRKDFLDTCYSKVVPHKLLDFIMIADKKERDRPLFPLE
jgi:hypothetical protein